MNTHFQPQGVKGNIESRTTRTLDGNGYRELPWAQQENFIGLREEGKQWGILIIGVFGFKPAGQFTNVVNRRLPGKRSIGPTFWLGSYIRSFSYGLGVQVEIFGHGDWDSTQNFDANLSSIVLWPGKS